MIDIVLLVCATCCDSFFMSIAYGVDRIRLPRLAIVIISLCGTISLGVSMLFATYLSAVLPTETGRYISFTILFVIGVTTLFQARLKSYVKKHKDPVVIKFKEISLVIDVFLDEKKADVDESKELSNREAMYLGIALSIDSLASGLAYGIGSTNGYSVLCVSFLLGILLVYTGNYIGKHLSQVVRKDFSWISGCMLLILAFLRLS